MTREGKKRKKIQPDVLDTQGPLDSVLAIYVVEKKQNIPAENITQSKL